MGKVVTLGEIMLRLSTPGNTRFVQSDSFDVVYGGGEANVAVSCANYGHEAYFVTKLPKHEIGQSAVNALRKYGVKTDFISRGGDRVGIYYLETGASMRPSKVIYDRAHSAIAEADPCDFDFDAIMEGADWFHWSGIAASLSQEGADTCLEALQTADRLGLTISCDLNFRKKLWNYGKSASEVMLPLVQYSDVIFGAEPEYKEIFGIPPVGFKAVDTSYPLDLSGFKVFGQKVSEQAPRCQKMFLELRNTITSNHNLLAAILYSKGTLRHTGIYDIVHEVDRVGAGDAFVGGMIYGLLTYSDNDQKTLEFALAASALKNTIYGDFNQVTVEEVEGLMQGNTSGRVVR